MQTSDFDFHLPEKLVAQHPSPEGREHSRLMVLDTKTQTIQHKHFFDIPRILQPGDVLVMNNSKVIPARLYGNKKETGGKIELLLLHKMDNRNENTWEAMVGGNRLHNNTVVTLADGSSVTLLEPYNEKTWCVEFAHNEQALQQLLNTHGHTPIPPYIDENTFSENELREQYQTVYAKHDGSAAAPTAGLHFTEEILATLQTQGVEIAEITLHVGLGTFSPVHTGDLTKHVMHKEFATISADVASVINTAKQEGRRIIAVGTTSVRTLESFMQDGTLTHGSMWTDIFLTPGYTFQCIDGMITNFHLPQSTLIMLVAAFAGKDFVMHAYAEAVKRSYRFYSFGDAMCIV